MKNEKYIKLILTIIAVELLIIIFKSNMVKPEFPNTAFANKPVKVENVDFAESQLYQQIKKGDTLNVKIVGMSSNNGMLPVWVYNTPRDGGFGAIPVYQVIPPPH